MNIPRAEMENIARAAVDKAWESLPDDTDIVDIIPVVEDDSITLRMVRPPDEEAPRGRTIVVRGVNGSLLAAGNSHRTIVARNESGNLVGSASWQDSRVANQAVREAVDEWLDDVDLPEIADILRSENAGAELVQRLGF